MLSVAGHKLHNDQANIFQELILMDVPMYNVWFFNIQAILLMTFCESTVWQYHFPMLFPSIADVYVQTKKNLHKAQGHYT